jgi:alanine racemase
VTIGKTMTTNLIHAQIDLGAIAHNVRELRRIIRPGAQLLVAVKANAYGHGAVETARAALGNGATRLGVARIEEGLDLRQAGIQAPILIFGYTHPDHAGLLLAHDLTPTVFSLDNARQLSAAAMSAGKRLAVHIKVDTGMGRLGLLQDALRVGHTGRAASEIAAIAALENIFLEGVFTHFGASDEADKSYTHVQFSRFRELLDQLESMGMRNFLRHAANSGAIIDMPETHLDMVRAGISVYGLYPSQQVDQTRIDLRPALALKSSIIHLKQVPAGTKISYGGTYTTPRATTVATIAAGYGDGYSRQLSNRGSALVRGQRAPVIGRVCMDLTMIDVGTIAGASVGDEVVLIGRQGEAQLTADAVAAAADTINYEVVTAISARVARVYND